VTQSIAPEGAEPGLAVAKPPSGRHSEQEVQPRGPDTSMEPRHRSAVERTSEPGPDDNIGTLSDAVYEGAELSQVIAAIGVGEDDHVSLGGFKTAPHGQSIAAPGLGQDRRAGGCRRRGATVAGTIVDDDHLASEPGNPQALERLLDHGHHAAQLVEAGQDDRYSRRHRRTANSGMTIGQRDLRWQGPIFRNLHWPMTQLRTCSNAVGSHGLDAHSVIERHNSWGMITGRPVRPVRFEARREREASRC
jgi:hypothetical protein